MTQDSRKSGIDLLGNIPWGTHFCQFYETKEDLLELLVPYFKAGLENNEFCFWIISSPLTIENAIDSMRHGIRDFDRYLAEGRMEILPYVEWYIKSHAFNSQEVFKGWTEKLRQSLDAGFSGMRVNGNETWLENEDWGDFMKYEENLNNYIRDKKMIILCTYQLSKTNAAFVLDVARSHGCVISKRKGRWEILEGPDVLELKADLKRRNYELEQKVRERTGEIERTVAELKKEIAEKVKIAEELKRSESRYRTLIEEASDAIIITDQHGLLIEVNTSFCKMVGYSERELIGMDVTALIEPEHLKAHPLRFDLLLDGKSLYRERQMIKKNGTVFPMEEHVKMLEDRRILAIVRDITERKRTEEALRQSEDRVRLIIDTIPTMAWTVTADGIVDYANKRWLDYAGEKEFENPKGIIHPDDVPRVMQKWLVNKSVAEPYEDEMRLRRVDGEYRRFLVRTAPLRNEQGETIKWYGVSIDIEDSKRAQDELQLAYQRLSYHVENTPLAVIEWDKDLNVKRWSARAKEIFGWTLEEIIGRNWHAADFRLVYEDDSEAVNKIDAELMGGLVDRNQTLNRNYTKDGKVIYCEWYNSVLRDEHGNVITILSLVHDVTENRKADETLRQSYVQIRQLTEHLQNIREEERIHIAREIHDELGGQLTALKMDASWLNQKLAKEDKAVKQRLKNFVNILAVMLKSVRRISAQLRPSLLDNLGLVAAIDWQLKEFQSRSGIEMVFNKPSEELEISDAVKNGLFRIFQESLTNVARHSKAKSVTVELLKKDGQLILRVEDDGQGFNLNRESNGKTLGILGMKERAAMMGGKYHISSMPGKGTSVTVVLPCKNIERK